MILTYWNIFSILRFNKGKDENSTITNTFSPRKVHILPIYGLYADTDNEVIIKYGKKEDNYASDIAVVIAIVLVVAGIGFGIWYARRKAN